MKKIKPIFLAIFLIALDQIVKFICFENLKPIGSVKIIKDFFYLTYVENRGAAFGMLAGARWIFIAIALVAVLCCSFYYKKMSNDKIGLLGKTSLVLISSGAIGNMIDRFFRAYVVDMFHFIFFGKDFAVFNVADIYVCLGTFLLAIYIIFFDDKKDKKGA